MKHILAVLFILIAGALNLKAQKNSSNDVLFQEIYRMDSLFFGAFNNRDLKTIGNIFSEDLEFYHDKTGLTDYAMNMKMMGDIFNNKNAPHRTLLKETMEVYPVPGFGAMQYAKHRFCHEENGQMDCSDFKFLHIWQKKDGQWKLARIVSFDH